MAAKSSTRRKAASPAWVVLKFGGTSVSSVERWETIAALLRQRQAEGLRPVVVHSALATVSNKLDELLHRALEMDVTAQVAGIRELHLRLAAAPAGRWREVSWAAISASSSSCWPAST
jgi:diaminopimelate decarboxylase/aspartate kinase